MITLTRKERDKQLRKSDILKAAERIFALKGFHAATMQDIAKEAQYATGTVYLYFRDKDALYFSLVEEKIQGLFDSVKLDTGQVLDAEDKVRLCLDRNLDFFEKNQDFFRIFLSERSKIQAEKESKFYKSSVLLQYKEFFVHLIKACQQQKIIRSDYDPGQIAEIFTSILMSVVIDWFKKGPKNTVRLTQLSGFILEVFLRGVGKNK
ncbi:MAG: TetR/AcrR family transcriptional regulator [Candidatus Omnitrophica bacterium]|nr:TetR/AcrR family transcriptional regulator [Candidatus Omnitrophota bacterium]